MFLDTQVEGLMNSSRLQPIVEIRRDEALTEQCSAEILDLLKAGGLVPIIFGGVSSM
jgi:hypothetical protein